MFDAIEREHLDANVSVKLTALGVREDRARELVAAGHPVRVYVPFGEQW